MKSSSSSSKHAPLLGRVPPPPVHAADPQLRALLLSSGRSFHTFKQWCTPYHESRLATLTQLRNTLDALLPLLTGARDFAGAAKVLSVIYHRFSLAPALCVQTSLEILRRQQPEHRDDLLQFYLAAIQEDRLDKRLLLKELWLFYVIQGDFYEAYHLYKDEIQGLEGTEDPRLIANFGVLCYWLLLIESRELREKLERPDAESDDLHDNDDDDADLDAQSDSSDCDDDAADASVTRREKKRKRAASVFNEWSQTADSPASVASLIEQRYLFKSAIGVHILYQEAARALRRAVSLCPTSAQFTAFYAQLLTLVGEVDTACDYVENLYHASPEDPHAAKMFAGFLEMYYPESTETQVTVYLRWLQNDPASTAALEKIVDLASAGAISSMTLAQALAQAVDTCGGDLYLMQPQAHASTVALWRHLALLLASMREEATPAILDTLKILASVRTWWQRVYFAHPSSEPALLAFMETHRSVPALTDALIYRAAVAYALFGPLLPIVRLVCAALHQASECMPLDHVRLFKSVFTARDVARIMNAAEPPPPASVRLQDMPYRHIVHQHAPGAEAATAVQDATKAQLIVHVLDRATVIVDTDGARPHSRVDVSAAQSLTQQVDRDLVAALEAAVRDDTFVNEMAALHRTASAATASAAGPRSSSSAAASSDLRVGVADLSLPLYVHLVEEVAFKDREAPINHIYTFVVESLRRLASRNVIVPTLLEVEAAHRLFLARWARNEFAHGHPGLLLRYDTFLAKFVQPYVHAHARAISDRLAAATEQTTTLPPPFVVTPAMVDAAMEQMQTRLAATHVHFPTRHDVDVVLRIKAQALVRLRRQVLRAFRRSMRGVLRKLVFLETHELAALALAVCARNGYAGVVLLDDLERAATAAQLRVYAEVVAKMSVPHRVLVRDTIDAAARGNSAATDAAQRRNCSDVVPALLARYKVVFPSYLPSRRRLQACVWMRRHERLYGPFEDFWECAPAPSGADDGDTGASTATQGHAQEEVAGATQ